MKLRSGRVGGVTKTKAKPKASKKEAGRPKKYFRRTCPRCLRKLKTPLDLKKHLARKLKCDAASVAARAAARKESSRRASKHYYYRKKMKIPLKAWQAIFPTERTLVRNRPER